ncbi:AAWKG family protein [Streptomyces sp. SYSU K217416]
MALDHSKVTTELTSNDKWAEAVKFFTGYMPPERGTIFDTLVGNEGIPLMKVEISDVGYVDYVDTEDLDWLHENSGYQIQNTDFVIPFYHSSGGAGSDVTMHKARITMLGNTGDGKMPSQGYFEGGEFTSDIKGHLGMDGKVTWDSAPLTQYAFGTGLALEELRHNEKYGTYGFGWSGKDVVDADSVTPGNFDVVAGAFDRVAQFFANQQKVVEEWQSMVGVEKNDAWRGKAAGVFWDLINKVNAQYADYAESMSSGAGYSKQGDEIRQAKSDFKDAVADLHSVWMKWEWEHGNPLIVLHKLLSAVTEFVWDNNIMKITYEIESYGNSYYGGGNSHYTNYIAEEGFNNKAAIDKISGDVAAEAQDFGELKELTTWLNIGNKAVEMWRQTVVDQLDAAAVEAMNKVKNSWSNKNFDLGSVESRGASGTLESGYKEDKAEVEEEEAERKEEEAEAAAEEAAAKQDEFLQWQKDQAAKLEEEREKDKAEMEAKEAEAKAEMEAKEAEAKAEMEAKEKEQEAKEAEAKAEAEAKEAEAKAEMEAKEKEAERKQAELEAKQAAAQARAENMQMMQMNQVKAQQEEAKKEQEAKEAEAKAEREAKEAQVKAEQEEAKKEQEAKEAEAKAEREAKEKEAERKQAELEAKQDRIRAEQEAKEEQYRDEQEQKQAEAQAKQDELRQEQEKKQAEAEARFDSSRRDLFGGDMPDLSSTPVSGPVNDGALELPGGGESRIDSNGRVITDYPDGSTVTIDPDTHSSTVTRPDGSTVSGPLNTGDLLSNPDGSTTHLDSGGNVVTEFPDGSTQTINPDTGTITVTRPDGSTVSGILDDSGPSLLDSGRLNNGSLDYTPPSYDSSSYEEELFDDKPYESPMAGSGVSDGPNTPTHNRPFLNSGPFPGPSSGAMGDTGGGAPMGGVPMGGAPMGGGMGGGQSDSGERVRNVIDGSVVNNRRSRSGAGAPVRNGRFADDEVRVAAGGPTAGGTPFLPPIAGGGGAPGQQTQTQSGERARDSWVPEDEDVWGTEEGGAPAVIGR